MSAPPELTHAYLGVRACGCFGFAAVDMPDLAADIGKDTEWLVAAGGRVERLTLAEVRNACADLPAECPRCKSSPHPLAESEEGQARLDRLALEAIGQQRLPGVGP